MSSPELSQLAAGAAARLEAQLEQALPAMAPQLRAWLRRLSGESAPAAYFLHPLAFPSLGLPWWFETSLRGAVNPALQADLIYSTMNGYYYIRLIDNVMDGHATVETQLLPALGFFHTQFQGVYLRYFAPEHPFWPLFERTWYQSAEAAMHEAQLPAINLDQFRQVSAQKVCAAKIPLAAVGYFYNRPELIGPWCQLVDALGAWHQLRNDLFDWHRDLTRGAVTYFLSEAELRRRPAEPVAGWVARQGFAWGLDMLAEMMSALNTAAKPLDCPPLLAYLAERRRLLAETGRQAQKGLAALAKLAGAFTQK